MLLPRIPARAAMVLFFLLALLALSAAASSSDMESMELEKRQTSAAPSFRFSVHTHAESAVKYAISPIYVSLLIGSAGVVVAGLMS